MQVYVELDTTFLVELPPCQIFERPFWAYAQLPNGWVLLRTLVFGDSAGFLRAIEPYEQDWVPADTMQRLLTRHHICPSLHPLLIYVSSQKCAADFARWYQAWEDRTFLDYCNHVHKQESVSIR